VRKLSEEGQRRQRCMSVPRKLWQQQSWFRILAAIGMAHAALPACAQSAPPVIPPNPIQQGLPLNWRVEPTPPAPQKEQPAALPPAADVDLSSPVKQIALTAPQFGEQVEAMLFRFIGQRHLSGQALEQARAQIWSLYRDHGRLVRVEFNVAQHSPEEGGSVLQVRVVEIRIREVKVQQEGPGTVDPALMRDVLASAKADLATGGALDLDRLDARIKRRLFLGDVNLRATLVPVSQEELDVNLLVGVKTAAPLQWVAQLDNYGSRTYGSNRATGGLIAPDLLRTGDRFDALAASSSGMHFGRLSYELPVPSVDLRVAGWASNVNYKAKNGAKGHVQQWGAGLTYPLYFGPSAIWTGYLNYVHGRQVDELSSDITVGDKTQHSLQAKIDVSYSLSATQSLHASAALQQGRLDLSALPVVLFVDQLSARTDGSYTKFNWDGAWTNSFGSETQFDARLQARGQLARKNLDQSEKFSLGGANGVRAYGSSEGLGDDGYIVSAELGYRPLAAMRLYGFYDVGHTRLFREPWAVGSVPLRYMLRGAGAGLSYNYRSLVGSLVYAHQLGDNPGLNAQGLDAEGRSDRYRLWLTLSAQF